MLLYILDAMLLGFAYIKELYMNDYNFNKFCHACERVAFGKYYRHNGFLFKNNHLCMLMSSIHELIVKKAHEGGLMGHFGVNKTLVILHDHFYCPNM